MYPVPRSLSLSSYVEVQRRRPPEVQTADSGTRAEIETANAEYSLVKKFSSLQSNFDRVDQRLSISFNFLISVIFLRTFCMRTSLKTIVY